MPPNRACQDGGMRELESLHWRWFLKYYSWKQLSVTVQVKCTQSGKKIFLFSLIQMGTVGIVAHMNRINRKSGGSKLEPFLTGAEGKMAVRLESTRLWIFMRCRSLVTLTRDLLYMPSLMASRSQCDAAVAAAATAVHCNTWLISSVSSPMQRLDGWGGSSLCRIHLIPPPPHG